MSTSEETRSALDRALAALDVAKHEVVQAEQQLETLLADIKAAPRAEKTSVSNAVEAALQRLRSARTRVEDAESTLATERAST